MQAAAIAIAVACVIAGMATAAGGAVGGRSSTTSCPTAKPAKPGTTSRTFTSGGVERHYLLTVPPKYSAKRAAPLVVVLHGANGTGAKVEATSRMPEKAGARGYVVVAPDALNANVQTGSGSRITGGVWNIAGSFTDPATQSVGTTLPADQAQISDKDDVAFINSLVGSLEKELCIDPTREYVTGKSSGAGMSTWLACQTTKPRFAAIAPVAGVNMAKFCPGSNVPPLITFHGDQDQPMPYAGNTVVGIPLGVPSVDTRMAELADKEGCTGSKTVKIGSDVEHTVWKCPGKNAVELYKVLGGGHTWPGEDPPPEGLGHVTKTIDATEVMLDFFAKHRATR
jgi:polyhydroxybutyrate depolymerase